MPLTEWNEDVQRRIIEQYPDLEGKSEGILFCAAVLEDEPEMRLVEMREKGRLFAPELSFSPVSITSAQIAMGRREKKARKPRRSTGQAPAAETPFAAAAAAGGRLDKINRKLGNALSVLENFDTARRNYFEMKSRIQQLNPSVLSLLAELDESAREILESEGLLQPEEPTRKRSKKEEKEGEAGLF